MSVKNFFIVTDAVPNSVTGLQVVEATSRSLTMSWNKPANWTHSALQYRIEYSHQGTLEREQVSIFVVDDRKRINVQC